MQAYNSREVLDAYEAKQPDSRSARGPHNYFQFLQKGRRIVEGEVVVLYLPLRLWAFWSTHIALWDCVFDQIREVGGVPVVVTSARGEQLELARSFFAMLDSKLISVNEWAEQYGGGEWSQGRSSDFLR